MSQFYQKTKKTTDTWLTPPHIVHSLGSFDLDPASHHPMPWKLSENYYALELNQNGLELPWYGRIWLNPPYSGWGKFLKKLSAHGNGIALIFARTETKDFFSYVWEKADALLFIKKRLKHYYPNGMKAGTAPAPSVLVAYGNNNVIALEHCNLEGKFIKLK